MLRFLTLLSALFLFSNAAFANESGWVKTDQSEVRLIAAKFSEDKKILQAGIHFRINDGWKIYWRAPGDVGLPITYNWKGSSNFVKATELWPAPERHVDYETIENIVYQDEVIIPVEIETRNSAQDVGLKLHVNFAICREICLISDANLELLVPAGHVDEAVTQDIARYRATVPVANGGHGITLDKLDITTNKNEQIMVVEASNPAGFTAPEIFIVGPENFRFPIPKLKELKENNTRAIFEVPIVSLILNKTFAGGAVEIVLKDNGNSVFNIFEVPATGISKDFMGVKFESEILLMILFSLLGGVILNVMPCVLPVLSIKLLGVIKHGGSTKKKIRSSFLATSAGIISSFILLAIIVVSLKQIGMQVGWGFHFQEPLFIISMVVLLTLFTANMWSFFEFRLPAKVSSALGGVKINDSTNTGSFLEGALATTLATPCTAPFLGTAVGYAFSKGALEIFIIFTFLGVGLALPYLLIAFFPKIVAGLPKPGGWMVKVKYFMGALLFITAIWLIISINQQLGIISAITLLALSILMLAAFYLKRFYKGKILYAVLFLAALCFIIPTFLAEDSKALGVGKSGKWVNFQPDETNYHVSNGKIVFVDITADWCLTCKANELLVLSKDDVAAAIFAPDVVAMRGDWTKQDAKISEYLKMHNRYGIPFNIVYGPAAPEGIILPELLTKERVFEAFEGARNKETP